MLTLALVVVTGVLVAVWRLLEAQRFRIVAEDAGLYGLGALLIVAPIALAWALLTARRASNRVQS